MVTKILNHKKNKPLIFPSILILFLLTPESKSLPPLTITIKNQKIFEVQDSIKGMIRAMRGAVNPEKTRVLIARRFYKYEYNGGNPKAISFDIDQDDFLNLKEFPQTPEILGLAFPISESRAIMVTGNSNGVDGNIRVYDTSSDPFVDVTGGTDYGSISSSEVFQYDMKKSADLAIFSRYADSSREYFMWELSTGDFKRKGAWDSINSIYGREYIGGARFNPDDAITQMFIIGYNFHVGVLDYSQEEADGTLGSAADIFSEDRDSSNKGIDFELYLAEYNHKDTSNILILGYKQELPKYRNAGLYLRYTGQDLIVRGVLKLEDPGSDTPRFLTNPANIQGTDFFFVNKFTIKDLEDESNLSSTYIVDTTSTEAFDINNPEPQELPFLDVTSAIKPNGVTTANTLSMELLDSLTGKWLLVGNDVDTKNGWAMIITLNDEYRPCHSDCSSCVLGQNEYSCLTCSNYNIIEGPSGCSCSENCLSCQENNNPEKCLSCVEGKYLAAETGPSSCGDCHQDCNGCTLSGDNTKCLACKGDRKALVDEYGPSSCEECHEACESCTVAGDAKKCIKCSNGYVNNEGTCEKWDNGEKNVEEKNEIELASIVCANLKIPGCEKCLGDGSKGCERCQRGTGKEVKDGISYCVRCGDENCEVCEMTPHGRQCQQCFRGFRLHDLKQVCEFITIFGGILVHLFGLLLI